MKTFDFSSERRPERAPKSDPPNFPMATNVVSNNNDTSISTHEFAVDNMMI